MRAILTTRSDWYVFGLMAGLAQSQAQSFAAEMSRGRVPAGRAEARLSLHSWLVRECAPRQNSQPAGAGR